MKPKSKRARHWKENLSELPEELLNELSLKLTSKRNVGFCKYAPLPQCASECRFKLEQKRRN